ncbi:MFS transporter [Desulfosarcina ovata]|uniref:MFS transporter n=2 Tax=Desulfosarcina ovata TaxID=83564 RepID=A0A5K8AFZ1_9BACT|nr:MFS transporter [Desulfosarcina ovata]BBO82816.1 MFS transporter [Desulfosarcina ovata subsp. sediminis]BBO91458.1 MFS transporter [Desulfosarcina ovata subsp. ovata]
MANTIGAFGALFTATIILLTGSGLLSTLLSTRMALAGFSTATSGLVLSCYFSGLLAGSFLCHRLIQRVGHIRAFTVFAATTTAAALLHGLYLSAWFWGALRFFSGTTSFGLFMVIESWLNECTEPHFRGRIFSIYMTLSYLGIGIGQQLLNVADIQGPDLFVISGILFALCLVPVSATEGVHPRLPETKPYHFMTIFRKSPLGMLGSMAAGLTNSAFYALTPLFCTQIGLTLHQLSWIMTTTVFSGLAAQWVIGSLSDRFDRTVVLSVIATAIAGFSAVMFIGGRHSFGALLAGMGVFGTMMFAVYPVAVARAHDIFGGQDAVAVSAGLLFAYSIGASMSPIVASGVMTLMGTPFGLFAFWCMVNAALAGITLYLRKREKIDIVPVEEQVAFVPMKSTSPVATAMDPRTEPEPGNP